MPESWRVRGQKGEPSTLEVDTMEGSISRGEPSMLMGDIVDGSTIKLPEPARIDLISLFLLISSEAV